MREPFESEPEAFRFVLLTVAAFAVIAAAALLGGPWVGVPVWAVLTAAVAVAYLKRRPEQQEPAALPHVGPADERRILVVERDIPAGDGLVQEIGRIAAGGRTRVMVVAPPQTSRLRHWASDVDGATALARTRLDETVDRLRAVGIEADAQIGDEDPLEAIDDALRTFGADEIVISAHADVQRVVDKARERYAVPVTHIEA